ncbi:MAG: hypothetical protein DCF28_02045 [Alphaproteobacteria bacterium]|nr:MAG: hypothetical protein DCF28_02045 [Alphaproteobacteria bacterium]PZO38623.1 MAG: hypothetical protein DCE92_05715 [Alphaproteobacteria bacterium]
MTSPFAPRAFVLFAILATGLAGCETSRAAMEGAGQFGRGLGGAATAPLEDFNLRREYIPTVLLQARNNPYDMRNLGRCATIAREVERLDDALGPDTDEPAQGQGTTRSEQMADAGADLALDMVRDGVRDFIPGRSWIRRLSGAEQHSREVQASIQAGLMRRSFLKGMGMQQNCAPPAAPRWFRPDARRRPG